MPVDALAKLEIKCQIWLRAYLRALDHESPEDAEECAQDAVRRFLNWNFQVDDTDE